MRRIGIMGGSFNPIHSAHLRMAVEACEQYGLEEVIFMPLKTPPHKDASKFVPEEDRKRMVQLAIDGIGHFTFSDMELKRRGTTYTCDTLRSLKEKNPDDKFYFIIGGDSLSDFEMWYRPDKILYYADVLAAPRDGVSFRKTEELCKKLSKKFGGHIYPVKMKQMNVSSSHIRKKLKKNKSVAGLCPEKVEQYIRIHGLYGSGKMCFSPFDKMNRISEDIYRSLASTLRPRRYRHTIGVAGTAAALACLHSGHPDRDARRAELAGVLHDCAKYLTGKEMLFLCDEHGISLTKVERENTALIHGKLGAYLAKTRYSVEDEEICSAISWHTTGRPEMSFLEKILYIADYIEPNRQMDCEPYGLPQIRAASFCDLDEALLMILENTVSHLKNTKAAIDEMTEKTYGYYAGKAGKNQEE